MSETRNKTKTKTKTKKSNGMSEVHLDLITYPMDFETDVLGREIKKELKFRYQTFGELEEFSGIASPTSTIHPADKVKRMRELLEDLVISPLPKEFGEWLYKLYEPEFEEFLMQFTEAKENSRKK